MPHFFTPWNRQKACGKKNLALHKDQFYSNTRVPKQLNTIQHESTRVRHESTRVRHESTRVNTSPKQVNKSKKVKKSSRRVNASQQKSDMSLTWI